MHPAAFARAGTNGNFLFPKHYLHSALLTRLSASLANNNNNNNNKKTQQKSKAFDSNQPSQPPIKMCPFFSWVGVWGRGRVPSPEVPVWSWWGCCCRTGCAEGPGPGRTRWTGTSRRRRRTTPWCWSPSGRGVPGPAHRPDETSRYRYMWLRFVFTVSPLQMHPKTKHLSIGKEPSPSSSRGQTTARGRICSPLCFLIWPAQLDKKLYQ